MASTYSPNLAIQLIATGDQTGQWGNTTDTNLGTLIESAISGVVSQTFADANITLQMPLGADGGTGSPASPVAARNMYINCVGGNTAVRTLFLPINKKIYVIANNTTGGFGLTIDCITAGGTTVTLPSGSAALLVCDGTNVFAPLNYFAVLTAATTSTAFGSAPLQLTTAASGFVASFTDGNNTQGYIGFGSDDTLQIGSASGSYGVQLVGGGRIGLTVGTSGQVTIPAPSTTVPALTTTGPASTWAGQFNGSTTVGASFGAVILAGSNTLDQSFTVANSSSTSTYFFIRGDGSVSFAGAAPQGPGTVNTPALFVGGNPVYSGAPVNVQSANYVAVAADNGKIIYYGGSTAHTVTITDTVFPSGALITVTNLGSAPITLALPTTTVFSPSGATGNRTVAQYGTCTMQKITTGTWVISGSGLT